MSQHLRALDIKYIINGNNIICKKEIPYISGAEEFSFSTKTNILCFNLNSISQKLSFSLNKLDKIANSFKCSDSYEGNTKNIDCDIFLYSQFKLKIQDSLLAIAILDAQISDFNTFSYPIANAINSLHSLYNHAYKKSEEFEPAFEKDFNLPKATAIFTLTSLVSITLAATAINKIPMLNEFYGQTSAIIGSSIFVGFIATASSSIYQYEERLDNRIFDIYSELQNAQILFDRVIEIAGKEGLLTQIELFS